MKIKVSFKKYKIKSKILIKRILILIKITSKRNKIKILNILILFFQSLIRFYELYMIKYMEYFSFDIIQILKQTP